MANQSVSNSKDAPANALRSRDEEAGIELDWNKTEPVNRFIISHSSLVCFSSSVFKPQYRSKSWDHWSATRDPKYQHPRVELTAILACTSGSLIQFRQIGKPRKEPLASSSYITVINMSPRSSLASASGSAPGLLSVQISDHSRHAIKRNHFMGTVTTKRDVFNGKRYLNSC